jgi:hypothetical protein
VLLLLLLLLLLSLAVCTMVCGRARLPCQAIGVRVSPGWCYALEFDLTECKQLVTIICFACVLCCMCV